MARVDLDGLLANCGPAVRALNPALFGVRQATPARFHKAIDPEDAYAAYLRTGSVHRAALEFDTCGETIRLLLRKASHKLNRSKWTEQERDAVRIAYQSEDGPDLNIIAKAIDRTHAAIACKAEEMGITCNRGEQKRTTACRESISIAQTRRQETPEARAIVSAQFTEWHAHNPHPKGMLGKTHTQESKDKISAFFTGKPQAPAAITKRLKSKLAKYGTLAPAHGHPGSTWKQGWREIEGARIFFRSRWEFNYALYLQMLLKAGEIRKWEHEPETFWFEAIRRGCRSYLPDFRVTDKTGAIEYHEVKGWMDPRSITKLKRMAKYHPTVKLRVIRADWFKANSRQLAAILPGWETNRKSSSK